MTDLLSVKDKLGRTMAYEKIFSYKNLYRSTGKLVDLERVKIKKPLRERKNIKLFNKVE